MHCDIRKASISKHNLIVWNAFAQTTATGRANTAHDVKAKRATKGTKSTKKN